VTHRAPKYTLAQRDPERHVRRCAATCVFVYLLPCRYEDILKVGYSQDPWVRMRTLHPRYFEFFDLDRALLVATETVDDARTLESELFRQAELHSAPAPLLVTAAAGGHTEWYRGAYPLLREAAVDRAANLGFPVHMPASTWLRERMARGAEVLYESTTHMLRAIESARAYGTRAALLEAQLRNLLDSYALLNLELTARVPPAVLSWYRCQLAPGA
jgi:hypothetical protein